MKLANKYFDIAHYPLENFNRVIELEIGEEAPSLGVSEGESTNVLGSDE